MNKQVKAKRLRLTTRLRMVVHEKEKGDQSNTREASGRMQRRSAAVYDDNRKTLRQLFEVI